MRKLYFVPIIHTPADMGTMGAALSETSTAALGKELWEEHRKTVFLFWEAIYQFFNSLSISNCKIYQDGLVAAGEDGFKIVQEGVSRGSQNYAIISSLLQRGATLIKTEDIALVQKEYTFIKQLTSAKTVREREAVALRYRLAQSKLLEDRDNYIAGVIKSTLGEGDTGALFIGAYHDVIPKLPIDIHIVQVKEVIKVREYHRLLGNMNHKTREQYQQLAAYLAAPVPDAGIDFVIV